VATAATGSADSLGIQKQHTYSVLTDYRTRYLSIVVESACK